MSNLLPAPGSNDDDPDHRSQQRRGYQRQRPTDPLPDAEQILRTLLALNGLLIMGMISPQTANVIQRNLRTVLEGLQRRDGQTGTATNYEALVALCRRDRSVLQAIDPFLSAYQLEALVKEIDEDDDDEV